MRASGRGRCGSQHHGGDHRAASPPVSPPLMPPATGPSVARIGAGHPGSQCPLDPHPCAHGRRGLNLTDPRRWPSCVTARLRGTEPQPRAAGRPTATTKAPSSTRPSAGLLPPQCRTGPHKRTITVQQQRPTGVHRAGALARGWRTLGRRRRCGSRRSRGGHPWPQRVCSLSLDAT